MIKDEIQKKILIALKEKKETELKVLRYILSEIKYAEINSRKDLTDEETISLLNKELKKRKEAIEMFRKNGRTELVEDEERQTEVIEKYLPRQMSEKELEEIVEVVMKSAGSNPNLGKVIGMVMGKTKGLADGSIVARFVKEKISGTN